MNNKSDKTYQEIFALLSVEYLFSDFSNGFIKSESPDWYNKNASIGFEVAKAQKPHIGKAESFAKKYIGVKKENIPQKEIDNFDGEFFYFEGICRGISDSRGLVSGTRHIDLALYVLNKKIKLLNKPHFKIYNENYLFLYLENPCLNNDLLFFSEKYHTLDLNKGLIFNKIILYDYSSLYLINSSGLMESSKELNNGQHVELSIIAKKMRMASNWINGTPFSKVKNSLL